MFSPRASSRISPKPLISNLSLKGLTDTCHRGFTLLTYLSITFNNKVKEPSPTVRTTMDGGYKSCLSPNPYVLGQGKEAPTRYTHFSQSLPLSLPSLHVWWSPAPRYLITFPLDKGRKRVCVCFGLILVYFPVITCSKFKV